jgi:hypothetical protein
MEPEPPVNPDAQRAADLMQQCEHLAQEIWRWRTRHDRAVEQLRVTAEQLVFAQTTIANMERSWFWRARLVWVRIRSTL